MEDKELKKLLNETTEGPSFGFAVKTMRKIEALETSKARFSTTGHNSLVVYLVPLVLGLLSLMGLWVFESGFFPSGISLPQLEVPKWNGILIDPLLIVASLIIALGFWGWIWWEKKMQNY